MGEARFSLLKTTISKSREYFDEVYGVLTRQWQLLQRMIDLQEMTIALEAGAITREDVADVIEEVKRKTKKGKVVITYG